MRLQLQPPIAVAPAAAPATLATVGVTTPAPVVAVGVDWAVLIPVIVTGISLLVGQILNFIKSTQNGAKSDAIHVLVNSGMTKALADLATAQEEIRTLRDLVTALNARVVGPMEAPSAIRSVTAAETERGRQVSDASRLPSAEVLAAQASTPAKVPLP